MPQDWLSDATAYRDIDAVKYPWMIGTPEADADGDGIRNGEEALIVNMTSPQPTHTDPTPLWLTDSTALNKASYTSQYYLRDEELDLYGWAWKASGQTGVGSSSGFMFSFEENEGYDTDGDWIADGDEQHMTSTPISDPQNFTDPDRRQAIWFPGENAAAVSYSAKFNPLNYAAYDFLRQFTVEAWIKPEDVSRDQVIIERVAVYGASTLSNNIAKVRANFRIGIRADGRLYGLFDTNDAVVSGEGEGTAYVLGNLLTVDKWVHVALSFNGNALNLYMNGILVNSQPTTQIPANGVINIGEDAIPNMGNFPVLGNGYDTVPNAVVLGAQALDVNGVLLSDKSTWDSYGDFYKGYLDEVRVWDGARSTSDIAEGRTTRFLFDDVSGLRDEVYASWKQGATRNDNDGKPTLPVELVAHYSFQTLPGATDAQYVAWEPSGFTKNVRNLGKVAGNNVPGDIYSGWWHATPVHSTVYKNYRLVPWIQNTVGHLPLMDGSTVDSQFWSESYGGMTVTNELNVHTNQYTGEYEGVGKIVFPNTANPYSYYIYTAERRHHEFKLKQMVEQNLLESDVAKRYQFELNRSIVGSSDLVPLGGAFAKRCDDMWDGNGASDAWELTLRDTNANGIPDWWEKVAIAQYGATAGFTWNDFVTFDGISMTAREAYIRDLARGMTPTGATGGSVNDSYKVTADADFDGIPDWWEDLYGIRSQGGLGDADSDGLSNYAEWLIGECFSNYAFPRVSPTHAYSFAGTQGQTVPDYFLKVGKLYLGEMFADHDFMEDAWEDQFDPDFVSRFAFDAWSDPDDDGWSNWAECRAATDPTLQNVTGLDAYALPEHPIPTIALTVVYNGSSTLDKPICVQAWRKENIGKIPDAMWRIGTGSSSEKYVGINPRNAHSMVLGPGTVEPGTVRLWFADAESFAKTDSQSGSGSGNSAIWHQASIYDKPDTSDPSRGYIIFRTNADNVVGSVNYLTGEAEIDFGQLGGKMVVSQDTSSGSGNSKTIELSESFVRVEWQSVTPMGNNRATLRLKDPIPASEGTSLGALREGKNIFAAFLDVNNDGLWTPGEPYGVVTDVDVGWAGTAATIELTDTAPQMVRINLAEAIAAQGFDSVNAATDRGVLGNGVAPNVSMPEGTNMPSATMTDVRVRIALNAINNRGANNGVYANDVVFDQRINLAASPVLTEKDLLAAGNLDLEWGTLGTQAANLGLTLANVTRATYRIVLGDGAISSAQTNNSLSVAFVNAFDAEQPTCSLLSPQGAIYTSPTFTWKCNSAIGKAYPAFRLRVYTEKTGGTLVYDSGALQAPARNQNGRYSWTAPIYPDMTTPNGQVFATTNNYFWTVSMLDAKFTTPLSSQSRQEFRLEASGQLGKISDYGMIKAKVRYYGPAATSASAKTLAGMIRVQAFTSPDFTGMPAGEARVTSRAQMSSVGEMEQPNAVILGLKPGTYYVRAFIDSKGTAEWANWCSWGYGNYVGAWDAAQVRITRGSVVSTSYAATAFQYTPRPYVVAVGAEPPVADIYIEDMDRDNDGLPDAWEYDQQGSLVKVDLPRGATFFTKVNTNLATTVKSYTKLNASSSGKTYAPITLMNTILSGSDPDVTRAAAWLLAGDDSVVAPEVVAVRIAGFSLAEGLKLAISADVPQAGADDGSAIFTVAASAKVKVVLVAAKSPDFADAREAAVKTITIDANDTTSESVTAEELRAAIDAAELNDAAFFKVRLEQ